MRKNGYTIVELLAVVAILIAITSVIAALITQTLRGGSKTNITNQVAQAGSFAVSVISNSIASAENVLRVDGNPVSDCVGSPTGSSIELLISEEKGSILYECTSDTIASNSASLIDTNKLKIDTSDPSACYFTCSQQNNDPYTPPIVEFGLTITQKSDTVLFENKASVPFKTSVLMRNYQPR